MKYMGIDMGTKRIGVARSDNSGRIAFAQMVIPADKQALSLLIAEIQKESIDVVVIGHSTSNAGVKNPVATRAEELGAALSAAGVSVAYQWEGYSSAQARRLQHFSEGGPRGVIARKVKQQKWQPVDDAAAAHILQMYLDNRPGDSAPHG